MTALDAPPPVSPARRLAPRIAVLLGAALVAGALIVPATAGAKPIKKRKWLHGVTLTQYYSAPESWFEGRKVRAPGIPGRHRVDWLYSALGIVMEGDGIGLDGRHYHLESQGSGHWVDRHGRRTSVSGGAPYWFGGGYWLTRKRRHRARRVTFKLDGGGWSHGRGVRRVKPRGITFGTGMSRPLKPWRSIAVDPSLIPLGSHVKIPAFSDNGHGGWFIAQDTGGAIIGRHIDIYRPPPPRSEALVGTRTDERVLVVPPRARRKAHRGGARKHGRKRDRGRRDRDRERSTAARGDPSGGASPAAAG